MRALIVPGLSGVIVGCIAWGGMQAGIGYLEREVTQIRQSVTAIDSRVNEIMLILARRGIAGDAVNMKTTGIEDGNLYSQSGGYPVKNCDTHDRRCFALAGAGNP